MRCKHCGERAAYPPFCSTECELAWWRPLRHRPQAGEARDASKLAAKVRAEYPPDHELIDMMLTFTGFEGRPE